MQNNNNDINSSAAVAEATAAAAPQAAAAPPPPAAAVGNNNNNNIQQQQRILIDRTEYWSDLHTIPTSRNVVLKIYKNASYGVECTDDPFEEKERRRYVQRMWDRFPSIYKNDIEFFAIACSNKQIKGDILVQHPLYKQIQEQLHMHYIYTHIILPSIKYDNDCIFTMLNQDEETALALKQSIAQYIGIPIQNELKFQRTIHKNMMRIMKQYQELYNNKATRTTTKKNVMK